ncbi:MAG: hypothetical protein RL122_1575 [Pseudomonadota bacterium]|jgi:hypothetical protein
MHLFKQIIVLILISLQIINPAYGDYGNIAPTAAAIEGDALTIQSTKYFTLNQIILKNGEVLLEEIINGPPTPPAGYVLEQQQSVSLPYPDTAAGINTLTVPGYDWVFGCSAVSGAMIAAFYDRNGYPNIYTGPTNGGVMPLNNSVWPIWSDGYATYSNCPLIASKDGVDGRMGRGSIDDYWVQYNSTAPDPYITNNWSQHMWGWKSAIGDYMKTSQSAYGNIDGSTNFWGYNSASKLNCADMPRLGITRDGTLGRKLFYEAKGYTVTDCYNQKTDNQVAGGFSFANYKSEIDAGNPVMLNLAGHTIVGVGYDDSTQTVYLHDTWDYATHPMAWGSSYVGMALQSVSIVHLTGRTPDTTPDTFSFINSSGVDLSALITSNEITVSGINTAANISTTGGEYSINGSSFTSSAGKVNNGNSVKVRHTSSSQALASTTTTLTIGGVSGTFSSKTAKADTTPDKFNFAAKTNAPLSTLQESGVVTITGINAPTPVSVTGGEYRINSGAYTTVAGTLNRGNNVQVRHTSASTAKKTVTTTLKVGSSNAKFTSTTMTLDTTPDKFSFAAKTKVPLSTLQESGVVTITGINTPTPVSVTGGEYRINNGTYTTVAGKLNSGDTVQVRHTSASALKKTVTTTLKVGSGSAKFTSTTFGLFP